MERGDTEGKEFNSVYPIVLTISLQYAHGFLSHLSLPFSLHITGELSLIPPLPFPTRLAWENLMLDLL